MVHDLTVVAAAAWLFITAMALMLTGVYASSSVAQDDDLSPGVFYLVGAAQLSAAIVVIGLVGS